MRVKITFFISLEANAKKAIEIINEILAKNLLIDKDLESRAYIDKVEPFGIKLDTYFYIKVGEPIDKKFIINELSAEIIDQLRKHKIDLACTNWISNKNN